MKSLLFVLLLAGALAVCAVQPMAADLCQCEKLDGFVPLFDGASLEGWTVMGDPSWSVQQGVLACSGAGYGWLRTNKEYRDCVLRLDYRIEDGGNSGVFLRATEQGDPAFTGLEIQLLGDHEKPPNKHSTMAVYDAVAPSANASRPGGDWNEMEVIYTVNTITVRLNGRVVVLADLFDKDLNAELAEPRKFWNRAKSGYIGLQNHGSKVEFRNIRVKPLDLFTPPGNP